MKKPAQFTLVAAAGRTGRHRILLQLVSEEWSTVDIRRRRPT
jgi:hypothetical protein